MKRTIETYLFALFASAIPSAAVADAPPIIPVQGYLTNVANEPVNGEISMTIGIYDRDAGGTPLYVEEQTVNLSMGLFHVLLGESGGLDLAIFKNAPETWISISVDSDAEMRFPLASTAYAAFAQYAANATTLRGHALEGLTTGCPSTNQVLKWNGGRWVCDTDLVGTGGGASMGGTRPISVVGTTVSLLSDGCDPGEFWRWTTSGWACQGETAYTGAGPVAINASNQVSLSGPTCGANQFMKWNGTTWTCETASAGITSVTAGNASVTIGGTGGAVTVGLASNVAVTNVTASAFKWSTPKVGYQALSPYACRKADEDDDETFEYLNGYVHIASNNDGDGIAKIACSIELPDGVKLTEIQCNVKNTDAGHKADINFARYNPNGNTFLANFSSTTTGSLLTPTSALNETVQLSTNWYGAMIELTGKTSFFYGCRIKYEASEVAP